MLEELGAGDRPRLLAFNKIDLLAPTASAATCWWARRDVVGRLGRHRGGPRRAARPDRRRPSRRRCAPVELLVPYDRGRPPLRAPRARRATSSARTRAEGVLVKARVPAALTHRFAEFAVSGATANGGRRADAPATASLSRVDLPVQPAERRRDAAGARARGRRRARPLRGRARDRSGPASAPRVGTGIAVEIPDGPRRPGAAALGPRGPPRHRARQRAGPDRLRLPRRGPRPAAQHRPRASRSRSAPATASPSSCVTPVRGGEAGRGGGAGQPAPGARAASGRAGASASAAARADSCAASSRRSSSGSSCGSEPSRRARASAIRRSASLRVLRQQRAVEVGAEHVVAADPLEPVAPVVAEALDHPAERRRAGRRGACGRRGSRSRRP